jgi:hypothetical protein
MAGALDGDSEATLMPGAGTGLAAGLDTAVFGDVAAQHVELLIVYSFHFFGAEIAYTGLALITTRPVLIVAAAHSVAVSISISVVCHYQSPNKDVLRIAYCVSKIIQYGIRNTKYDLCFAVPISVIGEGDHFVGDDFGAEMDFTEVVFPTAGLQAAFDIDLLVFAEPLFADFGQGAPGYHVEPFGLFMPLAFGGDPVSSGAYAKRGEDTAVARYPHFGVTVEAADDHYLV